MGEQNAQKNCIRLGGLPFDLSTCGFAWDPLPQNVYMQILQIKKCDGKRTDRGRRGYPTEKTKIHKKDLHF